MARRSVAADVATRMEIRARGLKPASKPALTSAAEVFRVGIEREFARNGLKKGANLAGSPWKGVLTKTLSDGGIEIRAANPAHLFNNPTRSHFIVAAGVGGTRSSRAARLGGRASRTVRIKREDGTVGRFSEGAELPIGPVIAAGRLAGLRATKSSTRGKKALRFRGVLRLYGRHPGTRGRPSFGKGRDRVRDAAARKYLAEQRRALNWGTTR